MSDVIYGKGVHGLGDLFLFTLEKQNTLAFCMAIWFYQRR